MLIPRQFRLKRETFNLSRIGGDLKFKTATYLLNLSRSLLNSDLKVKATIEFCNTIGGNYDNVSFSFLILKST